MGLARVTTSPPTCALKDISLRSLQDSADFPDILLGADVAHSQETYLPVPSSSSSSDPRGTEPVLNGKVPFLDDPVRGVHDIGTLTRMSAEEDVMVLLAHEAPALDVLPAHAAQL